MKEELEKLWGTPTEEQSSAAQLVIERIFNKEPPPYEQTIEYHVDLFKQGFDEEFQKWSEIFFYLQSYDITHRNNESQCRCCRPLDITIKSFGGSFTGENLVNDYVMVSSNYRNASDEKDYGADIAKEMCLHILNDNLCFAMQWLNLDMPDNASITKITGIGKNGQIDTETTWCTKEIA